MNKLNFAFAAMIACGMITFNGSTVKAQNVLNRSKVEVAAKAMMPVRKAAPVAKKLPKMDKAYIPDGNGGWLLEHEVVNTYNENGKFTDQVCSYLDPSSGAFVFATEMVYKYNGEGNEILRTLSTSYDKEKWHEEEQYKTKYDEIRTNVPFAYEVSYFDGESWFQDEEAPGSFYLQIERDAENRVVKNTNWMGKSLTYANYGFEFIYGDDGNASAMTFSESDGNGGLAQKYVYKDLKWHNTDSQFVITSSETYLPIIGDVNNNIDAYNMYTISANGSEVLEATYDAWYDNDDRLDLVFMKLEDGTSCALDYNYDVDGNGSYYYTSTIGFDVDGDQNITGYEAVEGNKFAITKNEHGDITLVETLKLDAMSGKYNVIEGTKLDRTYGNEGELTELIISYYSSQSGSYEASERYVYSDFIDFVPTGIASVENAAPAVRVVNNGIEFANAEGSCYAVCDINGHVYKRGIVGSGVVSINDLPNGMYIVKVDGAKAAVKLIKK